MDDSPVPTEAGTPEAALAQYCRTDWAVAVAEALPLTLQALRIGPGDEVITTPFNDPAAVAAVRGLGARPVFVDINPVTYNIHADAVAAALTTRTRAVLVAHCFGQTAEMDPILLAARQRGVPVVEDGAQSLGAEYRGRRAGSLGVAGCFSCGAVVTSDRALAATIRQRRDARGSQAVPGAALAQRDAWITARQRLAAFYTTAFTWAGLEGDDVVTPRVAQFRHVFSQYVVRLTQRDAARQHLRQHGIEAALACRQPLHLHECSAGLGYRAGQFPASELAAATSLALPLHPVLSPAEQERVVKAIAAFYAAGRNRRRQAA